jgi:rhamnose transport system substrate-binding protein
MNITRRIAGLTALALTAAVLAGCSGAGTPGGDKGDKGDKDYTIAMLPRATNIPYFDASASGGKDAAKELGFHFKVVGPTEVTAAAQLPFIQTLISQHVDAIVLSANDVNALLPSLKKAKQAGIAIVTFDSDTAPAGRSIFISPASSEDIGRGMMKLLGEQMNFVGDYAILSSSATSPNESAWTKGIEAEKADAAYAKMTAVKTVYGADEQASFNATVGLLQAYPNLKGIIGTNSFAISAAARAVQSKGMTGKVAVTGLGTPNDMRKYVEDGTAPSFELWSPRDLGYCGVYAAAGLLDKSLTGKSGESFTCGSVGTLKIEADGVTQLGKPTIFNKENIGQFNF